MIFRRLEAANRDITEAAEWYDDQQPHLGDRFTLEVEKTFDRIIINPLLYARMEQYSGHEDVRCALLDRFPYLVVYRLKPDEVLVIAVSHVRRKPFYWMNRLP